MNKWFLLCCALLAAASIASGDLGLTISIQGLSGLVRRSIGMGVRPVSMANSSVTINATWDSSSTIQVLRSVVADVVSPLGPLLEAIDSASTNNSGNPNALIASLDRLVASSKMAVENAERTVKDSELAIKSEDYNALKGNLTQLYQEVNSLTDIISSLGDALNQASSANPPYTAQNISRIITPSLITVYTTPLRSISTTLSNIGSLIAVIGKEKQFVVQREINLNNSIDNSLRKLVQLTTSFNRTNYEVSTNFVSASASNLRAINQSYAGILSKASSINKGNISNLTNFLANTSSIANATISRIQNNTASVILNLAYVLANQTTNTSLVLFNGLKNITDMAISNSSEYAMQCDRKYGGMLLQPGVSLNRLNVCLQSESSRLSTVAQLVVPGLFSDVVKWVGPTAVRFNMCSMPNGTCTATAFNAFASFSSRLEAKYNLAREQVILEQTEILDRAIGCVNTISSDIQDMVQSIQNKFVTCLSTGS